MLRGCCALALLGLWGKLGGRYPKEGLSLGLTPPPPPWLSALTWLGPHLAQSLVPPHTAGHCGGTLATLASGPQPHQGLQNTSGMSHSSRSDWEGDLAAWFRWHPLAKGAREGHGPCWAPTAPSGEADAPMSPATRPSPHHPQWHTGTAPVPGMHLAAPANGIGREHPLPALTGPRRHRDGNSPAGRGRNLQQKQVGGCSRGSAVPRA